VGAITNLRNYTIKDGFTFEVEASSAASDRKTAEALVLIVQRLIDQFSDLNNWPQRQRSIFWRSRRDGEAFVRCFDQGDGSTLVRMVEPEQVRQGTNTEPNWSLGILTDDRDIEKILAYSVTYGGNDDHEEISPDEISHLKLNVDECVKRGLSDFFGGAEAWDGAAKLLRNMRESGAVQAALAWIEQYESASQAALQSAVQSIRDQNRTYYDNPVTGREVNYTKYEPATILKVGRGKQYQPAPLAANTTQHVQIVQAVLRALGSRWNMPEYMVSGDASNANYASTLVSGSPFVNWVECEQSVYTRFFLRILWTVIRNAAEHGAVQVNGQALTFAEIQDLIDIHVTPPAVAIANKGEESTIDHQDIQAGVLSKQTRREKLGLDNEVERQRIAEEPADKPQPPGGQQGGQQGFPGLSLGEEFFPSQEEALGRRFKELRERYGLTGRRMVLDQAQRLLEGDEGMSHQHAVETIKHLVKAGVLKEEIGADGESKYVPVKKSEK
jgi:hypothetical protein